jgi:pimeloyl-ACP methyl ester carboxylesterase
MKTNNNIHIKWQDLFRRIDGLETDVQNRIYVEREIVPIIFVPGIMGSRLRRRSDKVKIWDPDDAKFMVKKFGWVKVTAAERKALLIGSEFSETYADVSEDDAKHNKKFADRHDPTREKRGWGGVMWGSYGAFLKKLQKRQWPTPLQACFELPVHAFGYNWSASNGDAGKALKEYIDKTIAEYGEGGYSKDGRKRECNKVIIVTHSMGGLVARSACVVHGAEEKVLGVIHGVQPAAGSPAAYWRMKAGFGKTRTRPQQELLGLAAQSPENGQIQTYRPHLRRHSRHQWRGSHLPAWQFSRRAGTAPHEGLSG